MDDEGERLQRARDFAAQETQRLLALAGRQSRLGSGGMDGPTRQTVLANLSLFSRIYVGGVRFDLSDDDLGAIFSQCGPVRSIAMLASPTTTNNATITSDDKDGDVDNTKRTVRHRGYGFIEFWTPEAAKLAQAMTDVDVGGRQIKVGRPSNFPSDLPPGLPRPVPTRLYVANLPIDISPSELESIMQPFGQVHLLQIIDPPSTTDKRNCVAAYVEYAKVADATNAMAALKGFVLAGHRIRIIPAVIGGPVNACGPDLNPSTSLNTSTSTTTFSATPGDASTTSNTTASAVQIMSTVMALRNVISFEELATLDDADRAELQSELVGECERCSGGLVQKLILHASDKTPQAVAFVQFATVEACVQAIKVFDGRWFDGRLLRAQCFDEDRFLMRDFDDDQVEH